MSLSFVESNGSLAAPAGHAGLGNGRHFETSSCWRFTRQADGWLVGSRPYTQGEGQDRLQVHASWLGPMKLVACGGVIEERAEFFSGGQGMGMEFTLDEEAAAATDQLLRELLELPSLSDPTRIGDGWAPPPADLLAGWLHEAGHEPAIDKEKDLRLTIKRRGCDGQVRIERRPNRLRLVLPLGRWENLDPEVAQVLQRLTCFANDRSRLARLAWVSSDKTRSCEAHVDLTGLPGAASLEPCRQQLWRDMLRMSVAALELVLRQLGVELPLLAEPRNRALVNML